METSTTEFTRLAQCLCETFMSARSLTLSVPRGGNVKKWEVSATSSWEDLGLNYDSKGIVSHLSNMMWGKHFQGLPMGVLTIHPFHSLPPFTFPYQLPIASPCEPSHEC